MEEEGAELGVGVEGMGVVVGVGGDTRKQRRSAVLAMSRMAC